MGAPIARSSVAPRLVNTAGDAHRSRRSLSSTVIANAGKSPSASTSADVNPGGGDSAISRNVLPRRGPAVASGRPAASAANRQRPAPLTEHYRRRMATPPTAGTAHPAP